MILTVANLKGGTGKTTSAAFLAHALAEHGARVLALDADPQASLLRWAEYGSWSLPVEPWKAGRAAQLAEHGWCVVTDTPPHDETRGRVEAAVRESTHVVVPIAPTPAEYERTPVIRQLIEDIRTGRHSIDAVAMLSRAVTGAISVGVYRELLTEDGWHVLRAVVGRREAFAQAFGAPVLNAAATAYGDAIAELTRTALEV